MSVIETQIEAGSPALKVVDLRVGSLENTVEYHTKELQKHTSAINGIGLEVKEVGSELSKMTTILGKIKTLLIGFGAGFAIHTAYQEGALKSIVAIIKTVL